MKFLNLMSSNVFAKMREDWLDNVKRKIMYNETEAILVRENENKKESLNMTKPVNGLAQTGALEDLIWSIMNDAETEAHYDRLKQSMKRDIRFSEADEEIEYLQGQIEELEENKNAVRAVRYGKTNIALKLALPLAYNGSESRYSCAFKHQLLSMAEMRDAVQVIDDPELIEFAEDMLTKTMNNASVAIAKFLGLEVQSCMACMFENNKIEGSNK